MLRKAEYSLFTDIIKMMIIIDKKKKKSSKKRQKL